VVTEQQTVITLRMSGEQVQVSMSPDADLKIKVSSLHKTITLARTISDEEVRRRGKHRREWETSDRNQGTLPLAPSETLTLDIYRAPGGGLLLHQEYRRQGDELVLVRGGGKQESGIAIEVRQ
jgi:hypothetical protein